MLSIEGFVLAGGASSRMGRPKQHVPLGGRTLVERAVVTLSAATGRPATVVLGAGSDAGEYVDIRTLCDKAPSAEVRGPLVGIYTALAASDAEWIALVAVDLPFVTPKLFEYMSALAVEGVDAVVPIQPDGVRQPVSAIYRQTCLAAAETELIAGRGGVQRFLEKVRVREVAFDEIRDLDGAERFFFNVNTPADLAAATELLG